ncbi:chemotaxis protein CheD [Reinekea blandensis]|nr:chemotaxis protein CheD [Reinekea blandensis]
MSMTTIAAGEHFVTRRKEVVKTLLGSCVAVCLFDPKNRVIGMNHFLLPADRVRADEVMATRAGFYGINAMELLINAMLKKQAERRFMQAKVFGGGNVLKPKDGLNQAYEIGRINIEFVREFLQREHLPIVTEDVGGQHGRVIYFDATDYSVYRSLIDSTQERTVRVRETQLLHRAEEQVKQEGDNVQIWNEDDV